LKNYIRGQGVDYGFSWPTDETDAGGTSDVGSIIVAAFFTCPARCMPLGDAYDVELKHQLASRGRVSHELESATTQQCKQPMRGHARLHVDASQSATPGIRANALDEFDPLELRPLERAIRFLRIGKELDAG
jgi:hypothetical protein